MPQEALILAATPWNNSAPGNLSDEARISNPFPPLPSLTREDNLASALTTGSEINRNRDCALHGDGMPALSNEIFRPSRRITLSLGLNIYVYVYIYKYYIYKYYNVYRWETIMFCGTLVF